MTQPVIEQGQLVRVRNRFFLVQDVNEAPTADKGDLSRRVTLECLDDDRLGDVTSVVWEREIRPEVFSAIDIPAPPDVGEKWDAPNSLDAFLHAVEWSSSSVVEGPALLAPFFGGIEIEDFQLWPVQRASEMPRVCLLLADGVGAGKTVEAGMVAQEMIARGRVRRVMIICPASLQRQWRDEMAQKFNLPFEIIDRTRILELRREYGAHVNPWNAFPRIITSMDFIKREQPMKLFRDALRQAGGPEPLREWDLLILDEAHHVAPTGRVNYVVASDRTQMMAQILPHFEHRLFLTATPHNGYTESFTALLEMLDPLRFTRSGSVDPEQVKAVMIRRLKEDFKNDLGQPRFPKRHVVALPKVVLTPDEKRLFDLLDAYSASRRQRTASKGEQLGIEFALTILKKRLLSSPAAFAHSLDTHSKSLGVRGSEELSEEAVAAWRRRLREDWDDDDERIRNEDAAMEEASPFFGKLSPSEEKQLSEMIRIADRLAHKPDSKFDILLAWIEEHLRPHGKWNQERVVIYTEYLHTLQWLHTLLAARGFDDSIMRLQGGMNSDEWEDIKAAFQAPTSQNPVRILLATDAAAEGANLQNHCRYLIHWEIVWNPNKLEQRNGRIDRKGQTRETYCHHFEFEGREDQRFLDVIIEKVKKQSHDLGAIGEVIARQVEQAMIGARRTIDIDDHRQKQARAEAREQVQTTEDLGALVAAMEKTRDVMHLDPRSIRLALDEALRLEGQKGLMAVEEGHDLAGRAWRLHHLPAAWQACRSSICDAKGRSLLLVFDHKDLLLPDGTPRRDVTLVHLNHALMQRAVGLFRKSIWSQNLQRADALRRVTYRIVSDHVHKGAVAVLHARVVAISESNRKLHEAVVRIVCRVKSDELIVADDDLYERIQRGTPDDWPAIPTTTAQALRRSFPAHRKALTDLLTELEKNETKRLRDKLRAQGKKEADEVRKMVDERRKEIQAVLKRLEGPAAAQLSLFDEIEQRQVQDDIRFLKTRLDQLEGERQKKPDEVKRRYELRTLRVFPLALEYILSESLVREGR